MKPTFRFTFKEAEKASEFMKRINNQTDGRALHPYIGKHADRDETEVVVVGTGSFIFDYKLSEKCDNLAEVFGGKRIGL